VGSPEVPVTSAQVTIWWWKRTSHTLDDEKSSEELGEVVDEHDIDVMIWYCCMGVCMMLW
jgi:hypothetical protein